MPSSGIAGPYGGSIFIFSGTSILFLTVAVSNYIPTNRAIGFPFLQSLQHLLFADFFFFNFLCWDIADLFVGFDDGHSDWCAVMLHYSFDLHLIINDY